MAISELPKDDYLLKLVHCDMIAKVKAELMKDVDPLVEEAAKRVVAGLETAIHKQVDHYKGETVLRLIINKKEVPHGARN
jgi:hypothetical protein